MAKLTYSTCILVLSLSGIAACTDKDRLEASKSADAVDTFKYIPPSQPADEKKERSSASSRALDSTSKPRSNKDGDGIDTFKFRPNPKYFPQTPKQKEQ